MPDAAWMPATGRVCPSSCELSLLLVAPPFPAPPRRLPRFLPAAATGLVGLAFAFGALAFAAPGRELPRLLSATAARRFGEGTSATARRLAASAMARRLGAATAARLFGATAAAAWRLLFGAIAAAAWRLLRGVPKLKWERWLCRCGRRRPLSAGTNTSGSSPNGRLAAAGKAALPEPCCGTVLGRLPSKVSITRTVSTKGMRSATHVGIKRQTTSCICCRMCGGTHSCLDAEAKILWARSTTWSI